mgnify:CR=1 FL=1
MAIDLRSDTVTQPTEEMRRAMCVAEVGDDVLGEDPTVNKLQEYAARELGFEAAVFVPTGTMGNLISAIVHSQNGFILAEGSSHVQFFERDTMERVTASRIIPVEGREGFPDIEKIREIVSRRAGSYLFCLENTHNHAGGIPLTRAQTQIVIETAAEWKAKVHIDGARIFNASVALNVSAASLVEGADSVMFCLSKGLSAPAGSLVVGSSSFVEKARDARDACGGGMRQSGILAAAGLVALNTMISRLAEDHARAQKLAQGIYEIGGCSISPEDIQTNILMIKIDTGKAVEYARELARSGVLTFPIGKNYVRMVTHRHITDADVETVIEAWQSARNTVK